MGEGCFLLRAVPIFSHRLGGGNGDGFGCRGELRKIIHRRLEDIDQYPLSDIKYPLPYL